MNLFEKPRGVQTRWASFENPTAGRNCAGLENRGAKGHPSDSLKAGETKILPLLDRNQPVDLNNPALPNAWCNFWRQDDWSATAYFYLNSPEGMPPPIAPAPMRAAGLAPVADAQKRVDG